MHICLFDIDGTLLSSGGAGKAAMESALQEEFGVPASSDGVPFSGRTDRAIGRDLFRMHQIEDSPQNWKRFLARYLQVLPASLTRHQGQVLPGIAAFLECLKARSEVVVGLLTGNVQAGARIKLSHYGLWNHFAFGGFGDHYFSRDEVAMEALKAVRNHLKGVVNPDHIWVIGDTPLDIRCARAIGARVVAVATGWHTLEDLAAGRPDLLLSDFSDRGPVLSHWGW